MGSSGEEYEVVTIVVEIKHKPSDGSILTSRRLSSEEDLKILSSWTSGGMVQATHALFIESLRSEIYLMLISMLSQGGTNISDVTASTLESKVLMHLNEDLKRSLLPMCEDTLSKIRSKSNKE